jgi:chromosome partitioning protein
MGEIVLAGGLKGGTGKSTTAANLVGLLLKEGKTVLGVDADDSENLNKWSGLRARTRKTPPKWLDPDTVAYASVVVKRGEGLIDFLLDERERHDFVVVDAGGFDSAELRGALLVADLFLVPAAASAFGVQTFQQLAQVVGQANAFRRTSKITGSVFANRASVHDLSYDRETLKVSLEDYPQFKVMSVVVRNRSVFPTAENLGIGIAEFPAAKRDAKAFTEVYRLYDESLALLGLPTRNARVSGEAAA